VKKLVDNSAVWVWVYLAAFLVLLLPLGIDIPQKRVGTAAQPSDFGIVIFVINPKQENTNYTNDLLLLIENNLYALKIGTGISTQLGIITCEHIIASKKEEGSLLIFIAATKEIVGAKITKTNHEYDLALVKPDELEYERFPKSKIAKTLPQNGEEISFFGCPNRQLIFLRYQKMGWISAYAYLDEKKELKIINQPYIPLFPGYFGDSGGGVFNNQGELIGIIQKKDELMPIAYALPITEKFLREIKWM